MDPGDDSAFRNVTTARHLPVAARGARQLQVGYVCARNQQHTCDRAHQEGHVIPREVAGYFIGIQSRLPPSAQGRLDELLALNAERGFIVSSATRRLDRPFRLDRGCNGDYRFDTNWPSDDCQNRGGWRGAVSRGKLLRNGHRQHQGPVSRYRNLVDRNAANIRIGRRYFGCRSAARAVQLLTQQTREDDNLFRSNAAVIGPRSAFVLVPTQQSPL